MDHLPTCKKCVSYSTIITYRCILFTILFVSVVVAFQAVSSAGLHCISMAASFVFFHMASYIRTKG